MDIQVTNVGMEHKNLLYLFIQKRQIWMDIRE